MSNAELSLRKLLSKILSDKNYENYKMNVKPISSEGANYTTVLFIATISAPNKEDLEIFAKVANLSEDMRSKCNITRLFDTERYFYTELTKEFEVFEKENIITDEYKLIIPKYYGSNDKLLEETIVLENLIAKGFKVYDRMLSVDWEYASKAIEELAKLQALSFAYGEKYPEKFTELLTKMKYDMFDTTNGEEMNSMWEIMSKNALDVVKSEHKQKLENFMNDNMNATTMQSYYRPIRHPVLIHGDYRQSNLMHKNDDDGNLQVIIIDYQTLQAGCPIMDLLYFIFNCSDEEFRGKYFDKLVEHYYTQLCLALRRLHVDPEKVYPREDFDYELKKMLPFGLCIGVFSLQIVTVEAANAPKLDGGLSEFSVKTSDLYSERLNGIVNDYVRWGIL